MAIPSGRETLPRAAILGAGALVAMTIALAGLSRAGLVSHSGNDRSQVIETREVVFADRDDGAVEVFESGREGALAVFDPGTNGFVRGALRGLARERKRRSIGPETPFVLARWADGRLMLEDPAVGTAIDLSAFGPDNLGPFLHLMTLERAAS